MGLVLSTKNLILKELLTMATHGGLKTGRERIRELLIWANAPTIWRHRAGQASRKQKLKDLTS